MSTEAPSLADQPDQAEPDVDERQRRTTRSPPKRRRTALACKVCRDRKVRCGAERPFCSSCVRKGLQAECIYDEGAQKSQRYMNELKERVRRLESSDISGSTAITGPSYATTLTQRPLHELHQPAYDHGQYGTTSRPTVGTSIPQLPTPGTQGDDDSNAIDALGTVSSLESDTSQFGRSSTLAFVSNILNVTNVSATSPRERPASAQNAESHTGLDSLESLRNRESTDFLLPPRRIADNLLNCYWEFIHPLFPMLHKSTFLEQYARLWEPMAPGNSVQAEEVHDTVFHSILNVVFALGCQFTKLIDQSRTTATANDFYQRSRRLLAFDIFDSGHLHLVQALLITGVYLQTTTFVARYRNVVGFAIRVAYGLGLNKPQTMSEHLTQLDVEMRRRIWHTCVSLDRLLAMTFGRPITIPRTWQTEVPSLIDDEFLSRGSVGVQPPGSSPRLSLFISSITLFEILDDVLHKFYIQEDSRSQMKNQFIAQWSLENAMDVSKLNTRLEDFMNNLPTHLRPGGPSESSSLDENSSTTLQMRVLNGRFLYVRMLLLRPMIIAMAQDSIRMGRSSIVAFGLSQDVMKAMGVLCVQTAHALIALLYENLDTNYRSTAWHSVYFTYSAATVLLASQLSVLNEAQAETGSYEVSWTRCMSIFERYARQFLPSSKAISVLWALRSRISTRIAHSRDHARGMQTHDPTTSVDTQSVANLRQTELANESDPTHDVSYRDDDDNEVDLTWFDQQFMENDWLQLSSGQEWFNP